MSDINEFLISANLPNLPQGIAISIIKKIIFQSQDKYTIGETILYRYFVKIPMRAVKIDAFSYTLP